jgi:hypothetical protein
VDNPYAFENMDCEEWNYHPEAGEGYSTDPNPFYPGGVCMSTPPNLSGTTPVICENGVDGGSVCPSELPAEDISGDYPRVIEWDQTEANLLQQSWVNPFDIAKGHRGFMDGDFLWSCMPGRLTIR